ncbi:MAG: hypothetical protein IT578_02400 [Verrucomicrobiae bacterium]|nr:hypothetical protein [Verrucomicrobiae bacterium]
MTVTDSKGTTSDPASVQVGVPKLGPTPDIWYFEDGGGDATYKVVQTISVSGVPSGKTITWNLMGQSGVINFINQQETATGTETTRNIYTSGWSTTENNLYIEIVGDGSVVATSSGSKFTARAPTHISESVGSPGPFMYGFIRQYTYTVKDKFNHLMPGIITLELFAATPWPTEQGCNWSVPESGNYGDPWYLDSGSKFVDTFMYSGPLRTPSSVNPGQPGYETKTAHNTQTYKVGGSGTQGMSASGFSVYVGNIQFCRGTAYR